MKYRIIAASSEEGRIKVSYFDDSESLIATYDIDLPVIDGSYVTGIALEEIIQARAPTWILERKVAVQIADNFSDISALVDTEYLQSIAAAEAEAAANAAAAAQNLGTTYIVNIETPTGITTDIPTTSSSEPTDVNVL